MAKNKAVTARTNIARTLSRIASQAAAQRSAWRWNTRAIKDDRVQTIENMLGEIDRATFELAQDVESGRVALDLPDEPRPLFERPTQASTKPIIETAPTNTDLQSPEKLYGIAPRPEMEPGTESQPVRLPHARRSQVELKTFEILDGDRLGTHVIGTIQAKDAESAIKAARSKHKGIIRIKVRNLLA